MSAPSARVLIVEDNVVNQKVLGRLLERLGCSVDIAGDGLQALEMVRAGYDLVFMDCSMPRMDGFEATRRIRAGSDVGSRVPVVAVTAHATAPDRARCLAVGMNDWLPKPVSPEDLASALSRFTRWRPAEASPLAGVLDAPVVDGLRALGGPDDPGFFLDLVADFRATSARALLDARDALQAGDVAGAREAVHRLRSASATVGAVKLAEVCGRFDRAHDTSTQLLGHDLLQLCQAQLELAVAALEVLARRAA